MLHVHVYVMGCRVYTDKIEKNTEIFQMNNTTLNQEIPELPVSDR